MADSKISALPAASTPLAGTEILPIVQSGATDQVTVANLTAGRAVSVASLAVSTGNIVPGTAAKGMNFTANTAQAGMTSQLFNFYEEGTFTATLTASTTGPTTPVTVTALYTKIGRQVNIVGTFVNVSTVGASGNITVTGLPFTSAISPSGAFFVGAVSTYSLAANATTKPTVQLTNGSTQFTLRDLASGNAVPIIATTGCYFAFNFTYLV